MIWPGMVKKMPNTELYRVTDDAGDVIYINEEQLREVVRQGAEQVGWVVFEDLPKEPDTSKDVTAHE